MNSAPPKIAKKLLKQLPARRERAALLGDFEEEFVDRCNASGRRNACLWYWGQVLRSAPAILTNSFFWSGAMFKNHIKIALRALVKYKGYSFINIFGLAVGMGCCLLILLWVEDELSFDTFHENIDQLYLVPTMQKYGDIETPGMGSPPALGPALVAEYPEIVNAARIKNGAPTFYMQCGDKGFFENIVMTDPELFQMFTFPLVSGDMRSLFSDPHVLVLIEEMAQKYFPDEDPVGKIITFDNRYDFTIVGVAKNPPANSSYHFSFWVPLEFARELYGQRHLDTWNNLSFMTFVQLEKNSDHQLVSEKISGRITQSLPEDETKTFLAPFSSFYLHSFTGSGGRIGGVIVFSIIAFIILLIACINFINLTTARSATRSKEVGLRKTLGAQRRQLARQFFFESMLFTFSGLLLALIFVHLALPFFNGLVHKSLRLTFASSLVGPVGIVGIVGIAVITGVISGSYPALFLSSYRPARVLRSSMIRVSVRSPLRIGLVVFQFILSIVLIVTTTTVFKQYNFMRATELGLEKENIIYIPMRGNLGANYEYVKTALRGVAGVRQLSITSHSPTGIYRNGSGWQWEGKDPRVNPLVTYLGTDATFIETFQIPLAEGNYFSDTESQDVREVVINERFASIIGTDNVVGKTISNYSRSYRIIGIVENFNFKPLYRTIEPLIIFCDLDWLAPNYMFIKLADEASKETIASFGGVIKEFNPNFPFEYRFLSDDYSRIYRGIEQLGRIIRAFAFLAIVISCLGLFGLATFMAEQRTKEIGIRKVMGASVTNILLLLSKEFIKWVVLANLFALPISMGLMKMWLQNYAYRATLDPWLFLQTFLLVFGIALFTVSYQALKAAHADPVNSLKYE